MEGDFDDVITALHLADQEDRIKALASKSVL
jgi:hypothetical protein